MSRGRELRRQSWTVIAAADDGASARELLTACQRVDEMIEQLARRWWIDAAAQFAERQSKRLRMRAVMGFDVLGGVFAHRDESSGVDDQRAGGDRLTAFDQRLDRRRNLPCGEFGSQQH